MIEILFFLPIFIYLFFIISSALVDWYLLYFRSKKQ